jgi:hypothetical protein
MGVTIMDKKHFIWMAQIISQIDDLQTRRDVAQKFAFTLSWYSPRFDRDKFLSAALHLSNQPNTTDVDSSEEE